MIKRKPRAARLLRCAAPTWRSYRACRTASTWGTLQPCHVWESFDRWYPIRGPRL